MKRNYLIVCLSMTLLWGCSTSVASKFGETLCDCANKAKGDRSVYQECADKVIHSSEEYQKVLKNAKIVLKKTKIWFIILPFGFQN